ncbi:maleylacetate reductase [Periconia macrospinosa]|uniref:Maleylacetate reductase n=1 Tax=Periconia macrospinosa TaxID=97972 RepID=A0A2V1E5C3_9PLEO|nr:maleylacetate reductase [Periconia macrospinosa]
MDAFEYRPNPANIIFGSGSISKTGDQLKRHGLSKPLILSTPEQTGQAEALRKILEGKVEVVGIFSEATMHTPLHVTEKALKYCEEKSPDCLISIGGGSTIGLGKAMSVRNGLFHIVIPTTYAGSEVTPVVGETVDGKKTTRSDPKILPSLVIYDLDLTMTLPVGLSVTSGINAIAHAAEALYAQKGDPITNLFAQEGTRALARALPELVKDKSSVSARRDAQYGAWLCGTCLGSVGMSLHHKLCHTLGGTFNLPHSETHTIVLPHALAYNAPKVPEAMKMLADALPESNGDPIQGLNTLLAKTNAPRSLKAFGMKEEDIDKAADIAVSNAYWNPRSVERDLIREVIRRAWAGEDARTDL